jgi:peroxiredoxin-like protein
MKGRAMKPLPHSYEVHLTGGPSGYAEVTTGGVPLLRTAPPPEFDGPGDAWSPEHLLLAAVESCFLFTLRAIARSSQLEFTSLDLDAAGLVERRDRATRFTEIVLRPRIVVAAQTDRDRVTQILEKTERACLVSGSLSTLIRVEPDVVEQPDSPPAGRGDGSSHQAALVVV